MIGFLAGRIIAREDNTVIIDVQGVGYRVFVSDFTIQKITKDVEIFVYTHVREQEISLYGFLTQDEYDMFTLLISISGIGPKAALNILSIADAATIATAIAQEDTSILTMVSGIGKRTAEKVVRELSGKVVPPVDLAVGDAKRNADAIDALRSMGYNVAEARDALSNVPKGITDVGECVKLALKYLGK
jgi:Holliday junction DNA helicase RuvA